MSNVLAIMVFFLLCAGIAVAHSNTDIEFQVCVHDGHILTGTSRELTELRDDVDLSMYTCETRKGTRGQYIELRSRLHRAQGR